MTEIGFGGLGSEPINADDDCIIGGEDGRQGTAAVVDFCKGKIGYNFLTIQFIIFLTTVRGTYSLYLFIQLLNF